MFLGRQGVTWKGAADVNLEGEDPGLNARVGDHDGSSFVRVGVEDADTGYLSSPTGQTIGMIPAACNAMFRRPCSQTIGRESGLKYSGVGLSTTSA